MIPTQEHFVLVIDMAQPLTAALVALVGFAVGAAFVWVVK